MEEKYNKYETLIFNDIKNILGTNPRDILHVKCTYHNKENQFTEIICFTKNKTGEIVTYLSKYNGKDYLDEKMRINIGIEIEREDYSTQYWDFTLIKHIEIKDYLKVGDYIILDSFMTKVMLGDALDKLIGLTLEVYAILDSFAYVSYESQEFAVPKNSIAKIISKKFV